MRYVNVLIMNDTNDKHDSVNRFCKLNAKTRLK